MTGAITIQQYLGRITQDIDTDMELSTHLIIFGVVKFVVGQFFLNNPIIAFFGKLKLKYKYIFF